MYGDALLADTYGLFGHFGFTDARQVWPAGVACRTYYPNKLVGTASKASPYDRPRSPQLVEQPVILRDKARNAVPVAADVNPAAGPAPVAL